MLKGNKKSQLENAKKHTYNSVTVKGENSEGAILSGILYAFYCQLEQRPIETKLVVQNMLLIC
jgi:hypothetical protein